GNEDLRDTFQLRSLLGRRPATRPCNEDMDIAAQRRGGRDSLRRYRIEGVVGMLCQDQGRHQITPASVFSFSTSSATLETLTPALRPGGSVVSSTFRRGATSTPRSAAFLTSSGFFFAFMMLGSEA